MRRLLVLLVVLAGLLVAVDRVAVFAAEHVVASRIQDDEHLAHRPDVSIGGFPFLTQLAAGTYDDVEVTAHDLRAGPLTVDEVSTRLHGVHLSAGAVVTQHVSHIPIDRAHASVLITYAELNDVLGTSHLRVSHGSGDHVKVTASAAGVSASTEVPVSLRGGSLEFSAGGVTASVSLSGLPFGLHLTTAIGTDRGVEVGGTADGLVLRPAGS